MNEISIPIKKDITSNVKYGTCDIKIVDILSSIKRERMAHIMDEYDSAHTSIKRIELAAYFAGKDINNIKVYIMAENDLIRVVEVPQKYFIYNEPEEMITIKIE